MFDKVWVYDLETMPNVFTFQAINAVTGLAVYFEVSWWRDDRTALLNFLTMLRESGARMAGYNCINFDYPIIHDFMLAAGIGWDVNTFYHKAQGQIHYEGRFAPNVKPWQILIPQIDLFKIHHFDNQAKRTSLKALEFNMRSRSIEELPFPPGTYLSPDQVPILKSYGFTDITETLNFFWHSKQAITFRDQLTAKTGRDHTNLNDTSIGKKHFIAEIEKDNPGTCYIDGKTSNPRQSPRYVVALDEVIFPYISFQHPEFQRVHTWLMTQKVDGYNVKGFFKKNKKETPDYYDELTLEELDALDADESAFSAVINGFQFDFGAGGIHGSVRNRTIRADSEHVILDIDVSGYYPEIAIANNLRPEHLGELFTTIYRSIKEQRKQFAKGTPENGMLKLAGNGVYGDSGNKYSPFYDPKYLLSITINGQLLLCMLAELLMQVPSLELIQVNTDGMTMRVKEMALDTVRDICRWWERQTLMTLEEQFYSAMFIRDVNAYLAVDLKGKVKKRKGPFSWVQGPDLGSGELAWHQDQSELVVARAAEAFFLTGQDPTNFIRSHDDIFDFMIREKASGKGAHLELSDGTQLGKLLRYYVSKTGPSLIKVMPPKAGCVIGEFKRANSLTDEFFYAVESEIGGSHVWDARIHTKNKSRYDIKRSSVNVGYVIQPCNNMRDAHRDLINFDYYIHRARKLIESVGLTVEGSAKI